MPLDFQKLELRETREGLYVAVHVQPGAKKTEILGVHGSALKIRVHAPPVEGQANIELQRFFCAILQVPRTQVAVTKGLKSRQKTLCFKGLDAAQFKQKIQTQS